MEQEQVIMPKNYIEEQLKQQNIDLNKYIYNNKNNKK